MAPPPVCRVPGEPFQGEAIDSWLEATARAIGNRWCARPRSRPSDRYATTVDQVAQLETIEVATGLSSEAVHKMTLSAYDRLVFPDRREDRQNNCRQLGIDGATK